MAKFTGRDGTLRIYDSAAIIAPGATGSLQTNMSCEVYVSVGDTFTDKTSEAYADDISYTGVFWTAASDKIYVGCKTKFAMIYFLKGGGAYAIAAGALVAKYYDGSSFVVLSGVSDGTSDGTDTFTSDGYISFKIPSDWAKQGDADLDADKYYIELSPTTVPTTEPNADILAPVDAQYRDVVFAGMDFSGPTGKPATDEVLVLNRGTMDSNAHYIEGPDDKIYEPQEISFSCLLDDTVNKDYIFKALQCGNCDDSAAWTATGTTSKGTTKNDGTNTNPSFAVAAHKTVNIQMLWDGTVDEGWAYYEVFFPDDEQSFSEGDDAVTLSCKGAVYGVIERIHGLGVRY